MSGYDILLDASGLVCPFPILKTKKAMLAMEKGQVIKVICTDASSVVDFESLVAVSGDTMLTRAHDESQYVFFIRKE
ncbi:MAG: hypothetical protein CMF49_04890 [Legionellales bacterium]|nr:hypothetical protein [Legionellales bacterium]|tara:strand:- start:538 stop:768 length:231 start_codon:yes stop_codon:yes gene_type:complete